MVGAVSCTTAWACARAGHGRGYLLPLGLGLLACAGGAVGLVGARAGGDCRTITRHRGAAVLVSVLVPLGLEGCCRSGLLLALAGDGDGGVEGRLAVAAQIVVGHSCSESAAAVVRAGVAASANAMTVVVSASEIAAGGVTLFLILSRSRPSQQLKRRQAWRSAWRRARRAPVVDVRALLL